jgi:type IV pilus assembly protein PilB
VTGITDTAATPARASRASSSPPGLIPPSGTGDPRRRLGDVAVELGFVDRELMEQVMAKEREARVPTGALLVESGIIDTTRLARMLAERNSLDYVDLNEFAVDQGAANLVDASEARRCQAIPIAFLDDRVLLVATADPSNVLGGDDIAMLTGYEVRRAIATPEGIEALISRLSKLSGSVKELENEDSDPDDVRTELLDLRASAEDAPVVKLVHSVIADAVNRGASDIHFDPGSGALQVR